MKEKLGNYVFIKTGRLDANAATPDGDYPFFTCAVEPLAIATFSYDCECVLVAGNGDLNVKYYNGKFDAYQRTYIIESRDKAVLAVPYLYYFLMKYVEELRSQAIGGVIKYIKLGNLTDAPLPIPSLVEQEKIVKKLQTLTNLISKKKLQLQKLDQLASSRFIEMFGDPVTNPRKWQTASLLDFGSCKNGMNYHANENGIKINCLGVGDFQDKSVIRDTSDLPVISLDSLPSSDYLLKDNDIVFVRSNGNKALVGRCVAVYPGNTPTVFSGFCIRFRQASSTVKTAYLLAVLRTSSVRKLMAGRGANIQNLNQQILASLRIPLPPLELQNEFAAFVEQLDKSKVTIRKSIEKLETTYRALLQEYFEIS